MGWEVIEILEINYVELPKKYTNSLELSYLNPIEQLENFVEQ